MYKAIYLIILLMLVVSKTTASTNDTIYYERMNKLSYDTIPYMVKDKVFLEGFDELRKMLVGEEPYSLKRAEFIVEWAYSGGNMDYSKFCHDIDSVAFILKRFIEVNNIQQYKTAPNYALFEYFTKPSPMNGIDIYRGMPIGVNGEGKKIITSARDIGNIAAGYVAWMALRQ